MKKYKNGIAMGVIGFQIFFGFLQAIPAEAEEQHTIVL